MRTMGRRKPADLRRPHRAGGFTYWAVLAIVAIMGTALAAASEVWHTAQKREKERELLFVGDQFRRALDSYYAHAPASGQRQLNNLEDLLLDPRYPTVRRHLRKIHVDPVSGRAEWGLVKGANGEIFGVHSLSEDEPMKKSHFIPEYKSFEGKTKYADWVFMQSPGT